MIRKPYCTCEQDSVMSEASKFSNNSQMQELVSNALSFAKASGATSASAEVSEDIGLNINVRNGEAETIEHTHDRSFSVTVYIGKRSGCASSGDFKPEAIERTVKAAIDIARYTSEDEYSGLPDASRLCREPADLDLCHPWEIGAEDAIRICSEAEEAAMSADSRIFNSEGVSLNSAVGRFVLGNTDGFLCGYPYSSHSLYASVIAKDKGGMQRDGWYSLDVVPERLTPAAELGRIAAERASARLGARELSPRKCPVIFEAPVAKSLISTFNKAVAGTSLYRKSSFLVDSLGKEVFAPKFSILEDPFVPGLYGSAPFDEEGVAGSRRYLVDNGVLQGFYLNSYSARKLGMETTGNAGGPYNVYLKAADDVLEPDLASLMRRMGTGLLVTELSGQGINLTNGDYSRGAVGFWVENGVIAYPVDGITIAGNLKDMFKGLVAAGADFDKNGSIITGSLLIDEMTVAGGAEGDFE